jgi:repressor LexA
VRRSLLRDVDFPAEVGVAALRRRRDCDELQVLIRGCLGSGRCEVSLDSNGRENRETMAKKARPANTEGARRPTLTARQREVFDYLRERIVARGYGPTIREIAEQFGIASPNGVMCHLKALEKKGLISREAFMSRAIQLTEAPQPQAALPLVGQLTVGQPPVMFPEPTTRLEFAGLFASEAHGCLRITGHGWQDEHLVEGDYLVIRRQSDCRDGELVLAVLEETTVAVKRYYRESMRVRLESLNRSQPPAFATKVKILGLVVGVIRQF